MGLTRRRFLTSSSALAAAAQAGPGRGSGASSALDIADVAGTEPKARAKAAIDARLEVSPAPWLALLVLLLGSTVSAATIVMGPADDYAKLEAALAGDVVLIEPGTYRFRVELTQQGTAESPIVIRAADPRNRPVWDLAGNDTEDWPGSYTAGDRGRGCWQVFGGTHYQISGIVFQNCRSANHLSAGLRSRSAGALILSDLRFASNDEGLFLEADDAVVEFCDFEGNGSLGFSGNSQLFHRGGRLSVRASRFRNGVRLHSIYSESEAAEIEYNVVTGAGLFEGQFTGVVGLPTSRVLLRGNLVVQSPTAANDAHVFATYHSAAGTPSLEFVAVWNTFIANSGSDPTVLRFRNDAFARHDATVSNNLFAGTTRVYEIEDPSLLNYSMSGTTNWLEADAGAGVLVQSVRGASPHFADGGRLGAELDPSSACVGAASPVAVEAPGFEPAINEDGRPGLRRRTSSADIGAFALGNQNPFLGPGDDLVPADAGVNAAVDGGASVRLNLRVGAACGSTGHGTGASMGAGKVLLGLACAWLILRRRVSRRSAAR
jgi:hypothetical protein